MTGKKSHPATRDAIFRRRTSQGADRALSGITSVPTTTIPGDRDASFEPRPVEALQ